MSYLTKSQKARDGALRMKLEGARITRPDPNRSLTLAWFGKLEIQVFAADGMEVSHWRLPRAHAGDARRSIERHVANDNYPDPIGD